MSVLPSHCTSNNLRKGLVWFFFLKKNTEHGKKFLSACRQVREIKAAILDDFCIDLILMLHQCLIYLRQLLQQSLRLTVLMKINVLLVQYVAYP